MPNHSVKANLKVLELNKAGSAIDLDVYSDGEKIGMIRIGQGSFRWKKKNEWKKSYKIISWTKFFEKLE